MPQRYYTTMLQLTCISSLLCGFAMAQGMPLPLPHLRPPVGRPPAVVLPPQRSPFLPVMPYPYPRVYVNPIVPLPPLLDSDAASRPPAEVIHGYLRLEVKPPATEIYVDGHFIGHSSDFSGPALVTVSAGGHRVEFRADGFGKHVRVFVSAGETVVLSHDLSAMQPENPAPAVRRWSTPSGRQVLP